MARMKVTPRVGQRRGPQLGTSSAGTPPSLREMEKGRGWKLWGNYQDPPTQALARMVTDVGSSTSSQEASNIRPTIGEGTHKGGTIEAQEVLAGDSGCP